MSIMSGLLTAAVGGLSTAVAGGAYTWWNQSFRAGPTQTVTWFDVWLPPGNLWGAFEGGGLEVSLLVEALRLTEKEAASLLVRPSEGPTVPTRLGIPGPAATRMPWVAAACGVLCHPSSNTHVGVPAGTMIFVPPAPSWRLGLCVDEAQPSALDVNFVPGSTIALLGCGAALLAHTVPRNLPWLRIIGAPEQAHQPAASTQQSQNIAPGTRDFAVPPTRRAPTVPALSTTPTAPEQGGVLAAWQRAWDDEGPRTCRLLVLSEGEVPGQVFPDLLIRTDGTMESHGRHIRFHSPMLPGAHAGRGERKPRMHSGLTRQSASPAFAGPERLARCPGDNPPAPGSTHRRGPQGPGNYAAAGEAARW
ncbi:hypothetical protein CHEID_08845 [Corynebacterium heidelbergense]|nr:hypothetical protein CHEID_08845 [Corynebacterium heidelbergense]